MINQRGCLQNREKKRSEEKKHTFTDTTPDKKEEISQFLREFKIFNFQKLLFPFVISFSVIHYKLAFHFRPEVVFSGQTPFHPCSQGTDFERNRDLSGSGW